MYDYILQFDDSVKAIEQEKGELAAAKYLYQKWKQEPASLNRLLCALTETWLALLDIDEDYDDTRQPFAANSGLEEYEDVLSETALYGRAHFPENATFLAYLSHMSGVIPYYFFALWDRQCSYEAWTDEMIALGERACQLQPENLFAVPSAVGSRAVRPMRKAAKSCGQRMMPRIGWKEMPPATFTIFWTGTFMRGRRNENPAPAAVEVPVPAGHAGGTGQGHENFGPGGAGIPEGLLCAAEKRAAGGFLTGGETHDSTF